MPARWGTCSTHSVCVAQVLAGNSQQPMHALSDRIGMQHIRIAADAQGMTYTLKPEAGRVLFEAFLWVEQCSDVQDTAMPCEPDIEGFPEGLQFFCIDDSASQRCLLLHTISQQLHPGAVYVYGETANDVEEFMSHVLKDGDVAILDQNLEYGGVLSAQGTDLIAQLCQNGFQGLLCIRSGNTSEADQDHYLRHGAHCVLGKEMRMQDMVTKIKQAYVAHHAAKQPFYQPDQLALLGLQSIGEGSEDERKSHEMMLMAEDCADMEASCWAIVPSPFVPSSP